MQMMRSVRCHISLLWFISITALNWHSPDVGLTCCFNVRYQTSRYPNPFHYWTPRLAQISTSAIPLAVNNYNLLTYSWLSSVSFDFKRFAQEHLAIIAMKSCCKVDRSNHRCNKRFFTFFIQVTFINVFFKFPHFLFLKNIVKCKVWICKNPTKNILRRWLSNDFYWFWFVT